MTLLDDVRAELRSRLVARLVDEMLDAYEETKRNFYSGGNRLSAVEAGRFCEAAFRLLEHIAFGHFTALGSQLDTDGQIRRFAQVPAVDASDSVRLHIPRALRLVYDIRNKRDAAHLADGIDPNSQDAALVVGVLDWVLAEFLRLYHGVSADQAQQMVTDLVTRQAPTVEVIAGDPKVLRQGLPAAEHLLLLLHTRGATGASLDELRTWCKPTMRANLRRTLRSLTHDRLYVQEKSGKFWITRSGIQFIEETGLLQPHIIVAKSAPTGFSPRRRPPRR